MSDFLVEHIVFKNSEDLKDVIQEDCKITLS